MQSHFTRHSQLASVRINPASGLRDVTAGPRTPEVTATTHGARQCNSQRTPRSPAREPVHDPSAYAAERAQPAIDTRPQVRSAGAAAGPPCAGRSCSRAQCAPKVHAGIPAPEIFRAGAGCRPGLSGALTCGHAGMQAYGHARDREGGGHADLSWPCQVRAAWVWREERLDPRYARARGLAADTHRTRVLGHEASHAPVCWIRQVKRVRHAPQCWIRAARRASQESHRTRRASGVLPLFRSMYAVPACLLPGTLGATHARTTHGRCADALGRCALRWNDGVLPHDMNRSCQVSRLHIIESQLVADSINEIHERTGAVALCTLRFALGVTHPLQDPASGSSGRWARRAKLKRPYVPERARARSLCLHLRLV